MNKFWKGALALGGLALVWTVARLLAGDDSEGSDSGADRPASPSGKDEERSSRSSEAGASKSEGSKPGPESDGGIVRDGRMRGGTWNFAPSDAASDAPGFLVLRDVPKSSIMVDGRAVELRGGFRGFRDVPCGKHSLELEGYGGTRVKVDVEMPAGGCIVLIYEDSGGPPRLEPDRDWGPQYIGLAMGGAMGQALWPWPREGGDSGSPAKS